LFSFCLDCPAYPQLQTLCLVNWCTVALSSVLAGFWWAVGGYLPYPIISRPFGPRSNWEHFFPSKYPWLEEGVSRSATQGGEMVNARSLQHCILSSFFNSSHAASYKIRAQLSSAQLNLLDDRWNGGNWLGMAREHGNVRLSAGRRGQHKSYRCHVGVPPPIM
jgi:hypothetical protein